MASSSCWRCLPRPLNMQLSLPRPASFSTTSQRLATAKDKRAAAGPVASKSTKAPTTKGKGAKTLRIKKKAPPAKTGKPPAPGERKAMRKRIVLSNTNALEVQGMKNYTPALIEEIVHGKEKEGVAVQGQVGSAQGVVGSVVGLEGTTVDSLRAVDAFKSTQGWGLFRRPGMLVREESVLLSKKLVQAEKGKKGLRLVVDGEKGTGKSLMLIHAMATAFVRGWVVVNIPEAQDVTIAVTDYQIIPNTTPAMWSQNSYIANLLSQIKKANSPVLQGLEISLKHSLPIPLPENTSLARLCELGARDPDIAWPVFQAFWAELTVEGQPPVLFSLDGLSLIMQRSLYRNTENEPIHAQDLAIIRQFTDLLSGSSLLPNGGAIIAATSRSHAPVSKSLQLSIKQAEDLQAGREITKSDPFEKKYDARAQKSMQGVEVLKLKGLSKGEARGLMEYWAASGVLRQRVDEAEVAEKWALAGNGVVGEIERGALRMRI